MYLCLSVCRLRGAPLVVIWVWFLRVCVFVCLFVSSPVRQLSQGLSGKSLQRSCCSINILHNRQPKPSHTAAAEEFLYRYHSVSLPFPRHAFLYHIVHICRCFSPHSISVTLSSCLTFSIFVHCPVDFPQRDGWNQQSSARRITPSSAFDRSARGKINSPQSDIKKWGGIPALLHVCIIKVA